MMVGGGALLGLGSMVWSANLSVRKNAITRNYLARLRRAIEQERARKLAELGAELQELNCPQGHSQIKKLEEHFSAFRKILDKKLNPDEVTYGRYLGIAEQVYLSGIDNLNQIAVLIRSTSSIDPQYIQKQIEELDNNGIDNSGDDYSALRRRLELLNESKLGIDRLLNENERAMTQLTLTGTRLARIETQQREARIEMESAMSELAYLGDNAEIYNRRK